MCFLKNNHQPLQVIKPLLAALLVIFPPLITSAIAQIAPGAGTLLQQVKPSLPSLPSSAGPGLSITQKEGSNLPSGAPFLVTEIRISGNTLFDTAVLHALVADAEGQTMPLSRLDELVARISNYYHSKGFPLARAIVPAQNIVSGVVRITVIEARYGDIKLENRTSVIHPLLLETMAPLQGEQVISQAKLDNVLLLLSDIPGVAVSATLRPGAAVGSSDLLVTTSESGAAVQGNVVLDNDGNRYTGRERLGGVVNVIDPLHHGDVLSMNLLSSGRGMNYGRISYDYLLNGKGTRVGGAVSALRYVLGAPLSALDAHGTAEVGSLWIKQTLLRSRDVNLYGQVEYDRLKLEDHIDASAIRTDRHLDNWTVSLTGDERDPFLAGGVTTWNVGVSAGRVGFDDAGAQLVDASTTKTHGAFLKWNANFVRLQGLTVRDSLYLAFASQWANTNLDPSQKMSAGGPYSVRGYDISAVSGDTGYMGTAELRHDLGVVWNGGLQAIAFIDGAYVTVNKSPWAAGANSATLRGAGVGLNWVASQQWSAKVSVAAPVGARPALAASSASARVWGQIGYGF